jgi:hypothetical protein
MGRNNPTGSYDHRCCRHGRDDYRISWVVDRYYEGSRLRWPMTMRRDTDEKGARRFCKKWGIKFPEEEGKK